MAKYKMSADGRAWLRSPDGEGEKLKAYLDTNGTPTIGVGHTRKVKMGDVITQAQSDAFLQEDLEWAEAAVSNFVHVPLNQNMVDALVSFVFNIGEVQFRSSTLLRLLNEGLYKDASEQFPNWDKETINGKLVANKGLGNRRAKEKKLFLKAA